MFLMKFLATKNKIEIMEIFICNFKYTDFS